METLPELKARQCTATNREGTRCRRHAIRGGTVCPDHGGLAPQTVAAAKALLDSYREPALVRLGSILEQGRDDAVTLQAIKMTLDRTGLGPTATLQIQARKKPADNDSEDFRYYTPGEMERVEAALNLCAELREQAKQRRLAGVPLPVLDAVSIDAEDGVLIEDDEPIPTENVANPVGIATPEAAKPEGSDSE